MSQKIIELLLEDQDLKSRSDKSLDKRKLDLFGHIHSAERVISLINSIQYERRKNETAKLLPKAQKFANSSKFFLSQDKREIISDVRISESSFSYKAFNLNGANCTCHTSVVCNIKLLFKLKPCPESKAMELIKKGAEAFAVKHFKS